MPFCTLFNTSAGRTRPAAWVWEKGLQSQASWGLFISLFFLLRKRNRGVLWCNQDFVLYSAGAHVLGSPSACILDKPRISNQIAHPSNVVVVLFLDLLLLFGNRNRLSYSSCITQCVDRGVDELSGTRYLSLLRSWMDLCDPPVLTGCALHQTL